MEGVTRRGGTGGGISLRTDGGDVDGGERSRARPVFPLSNDDTDSLCKVLFFATQLEGSCNKENTRGFLKVSYFFILDVYFLNQVHTSKCSTSSSSVKMDPLAD